MGIGKLKGVDYDIVEASNISRKYYFMDQIGMRKTEALECTLKRISPLTELSMLNLKINADNINGLFDDCDIIIEAFDDPREKSMLFDLCRRYYKDLFYIGASGVAGYKNSIKIKKMSEKVFIVGDFISEPCYDINLTASKVGIAANIQVNLAIQLILGEYLDNN
jgi:sulfur carrier protein ThiS adenylyltransferase